MRRRDFLFALATTPAALMFPDAAGSAQRLEGGVAVATVPLVRAIRRREQGRLIMHAVPRSGARIREVSFSTYREQMRGPPVRVRPWAHRPEERAPGEYHAVVAVPPGGRLGSYFLRWRITTEDDRVTEADHHFAVTRGLTKLIVRYQDPE